MIDTVARLFSLSSFPEHLSQPFSWCNLLQLCQISQDSISSLQNRSDRPCSIRNYWMGNLLRHIHRRTAVHAQSAYQHVLTGAPVLLGSQPGLLEWVCVSIVLLISMHLATPVLGTNVRETGKAARNTRVCGYTHVHRVQRKQVVLLNKRPICRGVR